jgi:BlaI family penicillinase repressor
MIAVEVLMFTSGELRVMRLLWEYGELKPSELQSKFAEPIKNPALRSYLTTLLNKGHVTRRKVGKAYFYRAKTPRQNAFSNMLSNLVDTFCGGSVEGLVMALVEREKIDLKELQELQRFADGLNEKSQESSRSQSKKRNSRANKK